MLDDENPNQSPLDNSGENRSETPGSQDGPPDTSRRSFLSKAAKIGITCGLAHFFLIGGKSKALAAKAGQAKSNDVCVSPYTPSVDNCNPDENNYDNDECTLNQYGTSELGDSCRPVQDPDYCAYNVGDECITYGDGDLCLNNVGDVCTYVANGQPDECYSLLHEDFCNSEIDTEDYCIAPYSYAEGGDFCDPYALVGDLCDPQTLEGDIPDYK